MLNISNSHQIVYVSCGDKHTALLTSDGGVFLFGGGRYGCLGHGSIVDQHYPMKNVFFMGSTVTQISAICSHVMANFELFERNRELEDLTPVLFVITVSRDNIVMDTLKALVQACDNMEIFWLVGILCGLCIYNCVIVNLPLPLFLYKKLLGRSVGLQDLSVLSPSLGRRSYVEAYVDYVLNKSVKDTFGNFQKGFMGVKHFEPVELEALIVGNQTFDFMEWQSVQ
ncbi:probable E3 ubiquitin-protein ligase HERC4 [Octopus sinensis]|uniref:Probable E3 ubiquitin-protein ligase HERC4 n=1 Tax=Octopus sinensis TaxID=2607531 RepID=A0A6P7TQJ9_9MOLL|nr:probable E3 ubiquitin-protein ligase HERC4 [Octopus sinensis]